VAQTLLAIAKAEDERHAAGVTLEMRSSHDVRVRRAAARALARVTDPDAEEGLLKALRDEDLETVGWGAYGLGLGCKGNESAHVRALAARAASLEADGAPPLESGARARDLIDPRMAIARALGRCGNAVAEEVLVGWIRASGAFSIPAAYGLGDLAKSRGELSDDAAGALLEAESVGSGASSRLHFLYPFGLVDRIGDAWVPRVLAGAIQALAQPSDLRAFAIRALARCGHDAVESLARIVESPDFSGSERAEAGKGLSSLGEPGRAAAGSAIGRLAPDKDPHALATLGGDEFSVLLALLQSFGGEAPKEALGGLRALSSINTSEGVPPELARRVAELRCAAAALLAKGAYEADVLARCDGPTSVIKDRARLSTLLRRPLVGDRRAAWIAFARSTHLRVRESALAAIVSHAELGDAARTALGEALESTAPGVVATATGVIQAHPDRVMVLSAREIRNALNPSAPPPSANPAREVDRTIASALAAASVRPWSPDAIETRVGLLDAAATLGLPFARDQAIQACRDANSTLREHAQRDLRALGDSSAACPIPRSASAAGVDAGSSAVPDADVPSDTDPGPKRVVFETDAGELAIVLEPDLAPVAVRRFLTLARQGFYRDIAFHRVVPGFLAQFGDPGGDGYGGSGSLLRCETSPVPFDALDVGVARSGRDTGSSQLFVTLGRYPQLDGEYTRVGHAQGDWSRVADGDVIRDVKVED
jgi:cyclophilin family peptidyl-prolyl cis-trans isomerase